jgi:outer membrane protein
VTRRSGISAAAAVALSLASWAGPAAVRAQAPAAAPLTLEGAISIGMGANRRVASGALEVAKAGDRLAAAKSYYLPELKIEGTVGGLLKPVEINIPQGTFGDYPPVGPIPNRDTTITSDPSVSTVGAASVTQPLSDLYKISLSVKAREALVEAEKQSQRSARQSVAREIRQTYYQIVSGESALEAAERSLAAARELERVAEDRVREQSVLAPELTRARSRVAAAEYDAANLRSAIATSRENLNVLLGRDAATPFTVTAPASPERPAADLDAGLRAMGSRNPDVLNARLQSSVADLDTRIAKTELLPQVSGILTYVKPWNVDLQPKSILTAGVTFKWEVFDGGRRCKEIAEKKKAAEQARLAATDAEQRAQVAAHRDWRRLEDSEALVKSSALALDAAREDLRIARERYDAQALLLPDLLNVQASLAEANHQYTDALVTFWNARADYESTIGEDL